MKNIFWSHMIFLLIFAKRCDRIINRVMRSASLIMKRRLTMAKKEKADTIENAEPSKGRKVMITEIATGKQFSRVDVIKELWNSGNGLKRGEIKKVLEEKYGHKVVYQIVFAATKGAGKEEAAAA
jgi:hypothetical protein